MNSQNDSSSKQKDNLGNTDDNKQIEKNVATSGGTVFINGIYTTINKKIDTQNNNE
jgi:hypothetical protein